MRMAMKLKYYLRGLGIGILITTIIFIIGIHVNQDQMFSDEEVIRRAKALGMVIADYTDSFAFCFFYHII